jgi:hypothetical protein
MASSWANLYPLMSSSSQSKVLCLFSFSSLMFCAWIGKQQTISCKSIIKIRGIYSLQFIYWMSEWATKMVSHIRMSLKTLTYRTTGCGQ